ncbi:MAG TPA: sigma-54 dependent transcriptional regulator [Candidatus Binatia bacterium]|nr:sigma-54 dependent transcriptional regulator [Candidatus Binatia bacterium]
MDTSWSALIIDDDPGIRQSVRLCLEADNARALGVGTPAGALEALDRGRFDVVFLDLWLGREEGLTVLREILRRQPGIGVVVITAFASFESAVEAMKLGAVDYLPKPFTPAQVRNAARRIVAANVLQRQISELRDRIDERDSLEVFETKSPVQQAFLSTARRVAATDSVVLLRGESGTGKNVLARWMRAHSKRADRPFVTAHCPMLSGDLMTSALFGHRKGAFTGAVADTLGKVEEAEGGTLFLDEVGDLTPDAQSRLLRFLNDRTYERLGDPKERRSDVRIIAATNRRLEADVHLGRFREDLFFRLNVISLTLPPLRERVGDTNSLAAAYLRFFGTQQGRAGLSLSAAAKEAIERYAWPGNLRELANAVERAVILAPGSEIEPADLGIPTSTSASTGAASSAAATIGGDATIEDIEREHIARVIARGETLEAAARILGIDTTTLQRKRKRYGLA